MPPPPSSSASVLLEQHWSCQEMAPVVTLAAAAGSEALNCPLPAKETLAEAAAVKAALQQCHGQP